MSTTAAPLPLVEAIARLYATFAAYRPSPRPEWSPLKTVTDAEAAAMYDRPLRAVTSDALDRYVRAALATWGDADTFRYFLPRLLELAALEPRWTDLDLLLGKLAYAGLADWPPAEQAAVAGFVDALWDHALAGAGLDAIELLAGIAAAGLPIGPCLARWRAARTRTAVVLLARAIRREDALLVGGRAHRWPAGAAADLAELFREPATAAAIEAAFVADPTGDDGDDLARAADLLALAVGA